MKKQRYTKKNFEQDLYREMPVGDIKKNFRTTHSVGGGSAALLVYLKDWKCGKRFLSWLEKEGFSYWGHHGMWEKCPWVFVNINTKIYACGMPGVSLTEPLGHHAVSLREFKTVYRIFKKYENKDVFVFQKERFDLP